MGVNWHVGVYADGRVRMRGLFHVLVGVFIFLLYAFIPTGFAMAQSPSTIIVIPTKTGGVYQEFLQAFRKSLAHSGSSAKVKIVESDRIDASLFNRENAQLVVTVGTAATQKVFQLNTSLPVLGTLVPRNSFRVLEQLASQKGRKFSRSTILLDQPSTRHMGLIREILPNKNMVSVVLGPDTRFLKTELTSAAKQKGIRIRIETMGYAQHLIDPLNRALEDTDAFMAVADNVVSNRQTVQNLLLTTYRQKVPVIGYSRAYVRAGALAAVYSTPEQIGKQAGELAAELVKGGRWSLPASLYPKYFSVDVNRDVARSLGIIMPKKTDIAHSLNAENGAGS